MSDVHVTCIVKVPHHYEQHYGITHLGGRGWVWWAWQQVISATQTGMHTFYTLVNGWRANIEVVNGPHGPYLRTRRDGVPNDNLLSLDSCPL